MAAYAALTDYENRHGTVASAAQIRKVNAKLDDASAMIASILPAGYSPAAELTRAVCVAAAWRSITNPGGRRSVTVGAVSESYDEDGGMYLTEREEKMLLAAHTATASTAYTVELRDDGLRDRCRR